ncbi:MAG: CerR family C-terminal domain-containing protein [Planctomycetota bacterium]|nr:CerR family C-terminal domain-containing protein [Planctomycetota bacterium]
MKKKPRKDAQATRERLLAAAAEVFAEKGYWEATHAEICERAGTNTASVNYHFGSKENLYVEAWKHCHAESMRVHPPDGGVPPEAPPEERLYGRILAFMHRITDPDNHEIEMVHKEMANPTGLLMGAMQRTIESERQCTLALVRELLGAKVSEQAVCLCEMSLMSQCFGPMLHLRRGKMPPGAPRPPAPLADLSVEQLADHIVQFTLAGIHGIRENRKNASTSGKTRRSRRGE